MSGSAGRPDVWTGADLAGADGRDVTLHGRYTSTAAPVRGGRHLLPEDRAVIVLRDGTEVWLEPLDQPASVRGDDERRRWDGASVRVCGRAHRRMPASGQSLIAPCLTDVQDIEPEPE